MLRQLRLDVRTAHREDARFQERLRQLIDGGRYDEGLHAAAPHVELAAPERYTDVQTFDYDDWVAPSAIPARPGRAR